MRIVEKKIARLIITGPMIESEQALEYLYARDYRVTFSGPPPKPGHTMRVDSTRFKIVAEKEVETRKPFELETIPIVKRRSYFRCPVPGCTNGTSREAGPIPYGSTPICGMHYKAMMLTTEDEYTRCQPSHAPE